VTHRRWVIVLLAGACVVLAACSSSPSTPKHVTTTTRAATTSTSSSTTTTAAASTTTSTAVTTTGCNHITATPGQGQGAAGTITGTVTVTNAGASACSVNGYPTMSLFSGSGASLTVTMVNGLSVTISSAANGPPSSVSLAPSGTAQFAYQYSDVPTGSETSCPTSESAAVTMPGATTASPTFQLAIAPCSSGTIKVSPVYSGS
jgi:uncharacterized protein DUF4232